MDLLEYQAKQLFQQVGIPVLPSQSICNTSELKDLHIPYPIVLKSQVRASGRAKVGGVKFVENTIDAIAAADSVKNFAIQPGETIVQNRTPRFLGAICEIHEFVTISTGSHREV